MKYCKKPCKECAYIKGSLPGWFGDNDPMLYADALHQDTVVPCHMKSKFDANGDVTDVVMCTGHLFAQKKACKRSLHPQVIKVWQDQEFAAMYEQMKDKGLGLDFYEYHKITPGGS